jgi:uncharacterized membrane protein
MKNNWNNTVATIMGGIVGVASAWMTIDWSNFDIHKEWPKLVLSAAIFLGGYVTRLNGPKGK